MLYSEDNEYRVVWLPEWRTYGELVGPMGAFFSTVKFVSAGTEYELLLDNDEFEFVKMEDLLDYDDE